MYSLGYCKGDGMKRALFLLLFTMLLLPIALSSCSGGETDAADIVTISKRNVSLSNIGDIVNLSAKVFVDYRELTAKEIGDDLTWSSSDTRVAVCNKGVVEVLGYGSCAIRATYKNGASAVCYITIPNPNPTLRISHSDIMLGNIGREQKITATSDTDEDISSTVTWISSNSSIATCIDGVVTAVGYGSCQITAISPVENKRAVCNVTVNDPSASYVQISGAEDRSLAIAVGEDAALSATLKNGAGAGVTWTSSDPAVATCENGVVRGVSKGVCAVLAITEYGYTDYVIVNVGDYEPPRDHKEYLQFDFKNLGKELLFIDGVGATLSRAAVISYDMSTLLLADGRLVVEITLSCVKTFDIDGITGSNPAVVTTGLYRENDLFCMKNSYKHAVGVGEAFTVKCQGFTVQTNEGTTARKFYMTFSTITEE